MHGVEGCKQLLEFVCIGDAQRALQTDRMMQCEGMASISRMVIFWILESVGKFCYSGDVLNAGSGADSAEVVRITCTWKKFRELSPILTFKGALFKLKGKLKRAVSEAA